MTDVEQLVREALRRHEAEVPVPDPLEARPVVRRARRRQVLNAVGVGMVAALLAVVAVTGIGALLRADAPRPAIEPTPGPFVKARGWIAFRDGQDIVAVDPANPTHTVVLGTSTGAEPIAWSLDGTQLLLRSGISINRWSYPLTLSILRADGSRTVLLNDDGSGGSPPFATWGSFSPDGSEVAYACCGSSRGPFVIDATGGEPRALGDRCERDKIDGQPVELCGEPLAEAAAWSPDGSRIAWIDFVEDSETYGHHAVVLSFVNPDGTGLREEVAQLPGGGHSLVWSPDGSRLAFWAADADDRNAQIYVIEADGSNLQQLTHDGENLWPTWSPDGTRIAFVRNGVLHTLAPDGTDLQEVEGVRPDGPITWNPVV